MLAGALIIPDQVGNDRRAVAVGVAVFWLYRRACFWFGNTFLEYYASLLGFAKLTAAVPPIRYTRWGSLLRDSAF